MTLDDTGGLARPVSNYSIPNQRAMGLVLDFVFWELLEQIIYIYIYISQVALAFIWQDYESMTEIRRKIRPKKF